MELSITLHSIEEPTALWITRKAKQQGISVEQAVLQLIHEGIQFEQEVQPFHRYDDLDSLAGTWSDDEAEQFLQTIADFAQVDDSLWL